MTRTIAVLASVSPEAPSQQLAKEAVMLVTALFARNWRVLVQSSPELLAPLLFAANAFRSATVVESPERAPAPLCLLPLLGGDGSSQWLHRSCGAETSEERISLLEILAATGAVDLRWLKGHDGNLMSIFQEERPESIVAVGGSDGMARSQFDAQEYAAEHGTRLYVVGPRSQQLSYQKEWRDLYRAAEIPEVEPLFRMEEVHREVGEEEVAAHHLAMHHASIAMAAEWLATRGEQEQERNL